MNWNFLVLPLVIPAITLALTMAFSTRVKIQQTISVIGAVALFLSTLVVLWQVMEHSILVAYIGAWQAPFGITMVADTLSAIMVVITGLMGLLVVLYSQVNFDGTMDSPAFQPVMHGLLLGVCGSFLTGDIFNLYVWFEVMLMSSFVLLTLTRTRASLEGALKYVSLNLISSAIFLSAVGILYAVCQSLNMADLAVRLELLQEQRPTLVMAMGMMFVVSFGIKAGIFPLYFWLPSSYHTPSSAVSAIFAGLLTKVGVYALLRVFLTVFPFDEGPLTLLLSLSGFTMLMGVFGAVCQFEIRRILSFHIISQIGYMVMGLGLVLVSDWQVKHLAISSAIFYMVSHIVTKSNLFLVGGVIRARQGTYDLARLGGLAKLSPWLAILFLISALSLAGIPPLSGFWSKFTMIQAGLMGEKYWVVAAAVVAGILTLMSMMKIWNEAFWKDQEKPIEGVRELKRSELRILMAPIFILAGIILFLGLQPQYMFQLAERAASDLLNKEQYINAVSPVSEPRLIYRGMDVTSEP
ncbi:MAG: proton-conducting transporter membrane subunit [Oligoflexus sp.]